MIQDLRYALRSLLRTPGFTLIAVLTLGLGIGATTAVFTVINMFWFKPLPVPEAGRLVIPYMTTAMSQESMVYKSSVLGRKSFHSEMLSG